MGRRRLESHLYQRPDSRVWWCWFYDEHGKLHRRSTKAATREGALAVLADLERRARDPSYRTADATPLDRCLADLIAERRDVRQRAEGTLRMYQIKAGHLVRVLGAKTPVRSIGARQVDEYVSTRLAEGAARTTVQKELVTLRGALKLAKRRREYDGDIQEVMPAFSAEYKPRRRFLTEEELSKLLGELEPDRAARVAFIVAVGARWAESEHARREDIGRDSVRLRGTKTALAAREVPVLPASVVPTRKLLDYAVKHADGSPNLFRRWTNARRDIVAACERARIPPCSPNDLRRTLATWLRARGVAPSLIGAYLGHADGRMVERVYGRLPPEELRRAITGRDTVVRERARSEGSMAAMGRLPEPKRR